MVNMKRGRPTDNPKSKKISVRIDAECEAILDGYCRETGKDRADAVRDGIRRLKKRRGRNGRKENQNERSSEQ